MMRRKDKLVTDKTLIEEVVNKTEVCRLGLVDGSAPYIVPLSFGYDGRHLYIHSATSGRKVDILKNNNRVCVEFEEAVQVVEAEQPCNWGVRYFSVIGQGTAELVTDLEEKKYGLKQIVEHYRPKGEPYLFSEEQTSAVLVFRITLEELVGKWGR